MKIKEKWESVIINFPSSYAITLAYNPHCRGSHAAVFRVKADASRVQLPTRVDTSNRLTTVRAITPDRVRQDVARLARNLDRQLHGRLHHRKPVAQWSAYIGFIEHSDSNIHAHLAWRCTDPHGLAGAELGKQWAKLSPFFTTDVQPLNDPVGWAGYILKNQSPADLLESRGLILSPAH